MSVRKSRNQLMTELFIARMNHPDQPLPPGPAIPNDRVRSLNARLMLEECMETIVKGLGTDIVLRVPTEDMRIDVSSGTMRIVLKSEHIDGMYPLRSFDMIETADGLADCDVVNNGVASKCGITLQPILDEVYGNNLLKFAEGHAFDEGGKLIKPPNHPAPRIEALLDEQKKGVYGGQAGEEEHE